MRKRVWIILTLICILVVFLFLGVDTFRHFIAQVQQEEMTQSVTLKWMTYGTKYKESDRVLAEFNRQLQSYMPGVRLELELVDKDDYQEKWNMKMAAGEKLDLAWLGSDVLNYTEEVKKGSLMSLDYLLKLYGEEFLNYVPEDLWDLQKRDGNIYAIPIYGPLYRANHTLIANKKIMDRFGDMEEIVRVNQEHRYTTSECFQIMEPFLQGTRDNHAIGTGVSYLTLRELADKGYEGIYGMDSPFVIRIFDQRLRVYNKYELESWRAYFGTMASWYQKSYIRDDVENLLDPTSEDGKIKGSILYIDEFGEKGTSSEIVKTEFDSVRGDMDGYRYIGYDGCRNSIVIPKTSSHPQEAVQLVKLLFSEEGQRLFRLLVNGLEKEHYIITNNGTVARMSDNDKGYRYQISENAFGNILQNYEHVQGEFEQLIRYNEEALMSPLYGFNVDTRMIALEMERVRLVVNQYKDRLSKGTAEDWEALYEEFRQKMREAGSEKVIEELQKQIDAFQKESRQE